MELLRDGLPIGVIGGIVLVTSSVLFATAAQPQRPLEGVAEPEPPAIEEKLRKLEQQEPQPEPRPSESLNRVRRQRPSSD